MGKDKEKTYTKEFIKHNLNRNKWKFGEEEWIQTLIYMAICIGICLSSTIIYPYTGKFTIIPIVVCLYVVVKLITITTRFAFIEAVLWQWTKNTILITIMALIVHSWIVPIFTFIHPTLGKLTWWLFIGIIVIISMCKYKGNRSISKSVTLAIRTINQIAFVYPFRLVMVMVDAGWFDWCKGKEFGAVQGNWKEFRNKSVNDDTLIRKPVSFYEAFLEPIFEVICRIMMNIHLYIFDRARDELKYESIESKPEPDLEYESKQHNKDQETDHQIKRGGSWET